MGQMTNEQAIDRLRLDIEMAQFDPITGNRRCLFGDEKELVEAQRLGMEALKAQKVGRWMQATAQHIETGEIRLVRRCSECDTGYFIYDELNTSKEIPKFCPNCGARMEGQE